MRRRLLSNTQHVLLPVYVRGQGSKFIFILQSRMIRTAVREMAAAKRRRESDELEDSALEISAYSPNGDTENWSLWTVNQVKDFLIHAGFTKEANIFSGEAMTLCRICDNVNNKPKQVNLGQIYFLENGHYKSIGRILLCGHISGTASVYLRYI